MKNDLLKDLNLLTTIPLANLIKLCDKSNMLIGDYLHEMNLKSDSVCEIDIGIGQLVLSIEDSNLLYKFIPSLRLENLLIDTIAKNESPLQEKVEKILSKKFITTYKDFV